MAEVENLERVLNLLRVHTRANESFDSETPLDRLEIDSVGMASFVIDLEEAFSILVTDEAFNKWIKVGDIAEYLKGYLEEYGNGKLSEM